MTKRISEEEIEKLYEEYGTPEKVKRHCLAVTQTAITIAEALNERGFKLDIDLIRGAGLSHDAARTRDQHWNVIADRLADMGYVDESNIVRVHMNGAGYNPIEAISETDMIWLGDRLVLEDRYVGIDIRFDYIIKKADKYGFKDINKILKSKEEMLKQMTEIESVIGRKIDSLFA